MGFLRVLFTVYMTAGSPQRRFLSFSLRIPHVLSRCSALATCCTLTKVRPWQVSSWAGRDAIWICSLQFAIDFSPGNLCSSFGLPCQLRHILEALFDSLLRTSWSQPVQSTLLMGPLRLSIILSEVLLARESSLSQQSAQVTMHSKFQEHDLIEEREIQREIARRKGGSSWFLPCAPEEDPMPFRSEYSEWQTWWCRVGGKWWWSRAKWPRPNPIRCPWCEQMTSLHTRLWKLQSAIFEEGTSLIPLHWTRTYFTVFHLN